MPLTHAPLCSRCGERHTKHPTGLCSYCRRLGPETYCRVCGQRTRYGRTYCYRCLSQASPWGDLEAAIQTQRTMLTLLERRKAGFSFAEISKTLGLSKSTVFTFYRHAMKVAEYLSPEALDECGA